MTGQRQDGFKKNCSYKLRISILSCIFIFCFEKVAATTTCEDKFDSSAKVPNEYSVRSSVWKVLTKTGGGGTAFFVNHPSTEGASGSPIVDVNKQVVGVLKKGDSDSNMVFSVILDNLQVFVQAGLGNVPRNDFKQMVDEEIESLKNLAEQGLASAQFELGMMYFRGGGVVQSFEKAFYWYEKAAEQGHVKAKAQVVIRSVEKGLRWFTGDS